MKLEGFWWSEREPHLPMPEPQGNGVSLQFIAKLRDVEAKAQKTLYRGWSNCRLCAKANGNGEYEFNGWRWPEGYIHYLEGHNVHPSWEFRQMIEAAE